jgi:acyl-CoA thioester hydrolase
MATSGADPLEFSARWRVRSYELDANGHVNNAVYLNWAEEIATEHAEAAGYGKAFTLARGGAWLIRRSEITHHRPAVYGDMVEVRVRVESIRGVRAVRRTWIRRDTDQLLLAEVLTEWVWVRLTDGRPTRVPNELLELTRQSSASALDSRNPSSL